MRDLQEIYKADLHAAQEAHNTAIDAARKKLEDATNARFAAFNGDPVFVSMPQIVDVDDEIKRMAEKLAPREGGSND